MGVKMTSKKKKKKKRSSLPIGIIIIIITNSYIAHLITVRNINALYGQKWNSEQGNSLFIQLYNTIKLIR